MSARRWAAILLSLGIVAGCYGPGAVPTQSVQLQTPATSPTELPMTLGAEMLAWLDLPVDPDLQPISTGNLSPDASGVLDTCWITDTKHELVAVIGVEPVAGMAQVPHAWDLPKYLPLFTDPQIDFEQPAWAIRLQGEVVIPHVDMRDPACVVIGENRYWFTTGASKINGVWEEAKRPDTPPQFRLPPLLP